MFETVLVVDRGLLGVRVIRSCQRLGIKAVTCVAEGDENALHARLADEAIRLGAPAEPQSPGYDVAAVIEAARVSGAQAVHPGGGRGDARSALARRVLEAGLAWVGAVPGAPALLPAWRATVRRGGRTLLWEIAAAEPGEVAPDPGLVAPDRLTEAVTGVDLVERALRRAAGERLDDLPAGSGHAMQVAVYAGPQTLVPVAVTGWVEPEAEGVVTDSVLADGAWLTRYDDAVLALVTAHGHDRAQALSRLTAAIDGIAVSQPPAELAALRALLREPEVTAMIG